MTNEQGAEPRRLTGRSVALCAEADPELWFPESGEPTARGEADLRLVRGAGRVSGVRVGAERAVRRVGWAVGAGAPVLAPPVRARGCRPVVEPEGEAA